MPPLNLEILKLQLLFHEGFRQFPYQDTTGHPTIGIGRNLATRGITLAEALALLENDILAVDMQLKVAFPWYDALDQSRKHALLDMTFNLGLAGLRKFRKFLAALAASDWELASQEMLNSKWASQVGRRALELAEVMRG